ncbi:acyltransferase [Salmonella enterica]|nr:acyltransferase [Salmonella enterica]ELM2705329.1 acyltransferase [Salmonella enterica]
MKTKKLYGIESLRGIAALAVAIGHNRGLFGQVDQWSFMDRITANAIFGVELFFIISGFIISYSTKNITNTSLNNTLSFLIKRFFRIYPVYAIILSVYIFLFYHNVYTGASWSGVFSLNNIIKSFLLIPLDGSIQPPYYGWGTLIVSWSLGYEIYFYFIFAISMSISIKHRVLITSCFLIAVSTILSFYFNHSVVIDAQSFNVSKTGLFSHIGFIGNPIVYDFILGMIISEALPLLRHKRMNNVIINSLCVFILGMMFVFWLNGVSEGHGLTRSAYIAFLIVISVIILESNKVISFNKSLVALGSISYSLYLVHVPVIQFIEFYGSSIGVSTEHRSLAIYISSITISITLSYLIYNVIEKPFIKIGHSIAKRIS